MAVNTLMCVVVKTVVSEQSELYECLMPWSRKSERFSKKRNGMWTKAIHL